MNEHYLIDDEDPLKGMLVKEITCNSLITENVMATVEEIQHFTFDSESSRNGDGETPSNAEPSILMKSLESHLGDCRSAKQKMAEALRQ